jgi:RIO kinase 1
MGVRVPHPIAMKNNILVMSLIGHGEQVAPQLKDVDLEPGDAKRIYEKIVEYISVLYNGAGLVHADLSEFNILYDEGEPVIIDMGQSVTLDHPMARKFLERDIANVIHYFQKKYAIGSSEEIWTRLRKDRDDAALNKEADQMKKADQKKEADQIKRADQMKGD